MAILPMLRGPLSPARYRYPSQAPDNTFHGWRRAFNPFSLSGPGNLLYNGFLVPVSSGGGRTGIGSTALVRWGRSRGFFAGFVQTSPPPPVILSVTPPAGSSVGGDAIAVLGHFFTGATAVRFNATPAASFSVQVGGNTIDVVTPALPAGVYAVTVVTPSGTFTLPGSFTVSAAPPAPTAITPNNGAALAAHPVTIAGVPGAAHFTGATAVTIGGLPCTTVHVVNQDTLTCDTPAALAAGGPYDVQVTTPNGIGTLLAAYTAT